MSCQSLARAYTDTDSHAPFHRSVRFSSESRSSAREKRENDNEKKETAAEIGSISLTSISVATPTSCVMSQSAPSATSALTFDLQETPAPPAAACRFPKLEECAHFHYERVSLGGLSIETVLPSDQMCPQSDEGWICLKVRSHVNQSSEEAVEPRTLTSSWTEASDVREWTLTRNKDNFLQLDEMLHRCIYDRKVSCLPNLKDELKRHPVQATEEYNQLISDYVHHLSIIADDSLNCGPVLNWLQMDNKGHKLLVANEDSSSINTPAVAAAYSVRKYVSQARDEISFEVGDMISIIDMPGPNESLWWRGKRGFRVGFFPHHCVAVIGDKVPRHMTQPPPIVGSVAVAPIKPVLRKHGKLISLFRSFILSRPSRPSLKQQGILKERVFGCDLGEHLLNCNRDVPLVLVECASFIEARGAVDGIYRLSGGSGLTQKLRAEFDTNSSPDLRHPQVSRDPHAVASLLKMYFRELPNPLCTYQLYESFVSSVQRPDENTRLRAVRDAVVKLPPPHYRTMAYLMRHLRRVSLLGECTGMTARNMAIVWAPNLLRSPTPQHALQGVAVQAVVTEFLICFAEELFSEEQGNDSGPSSIDPEEPKYECIVELRGTDSCRRPKSLPLNPPTKLLSLEEARRRGAPPAPTSGSAVTSSCVTSSRVTSPPSIQLRPQTDHKPKYIEVGSGPNNLPQYHTVLELPGPGGSRGLKRSPSGWRGLFSRSKQQRPRNNTLTHPPTQPDAQEPPVHIDTPMAGLRPVKSCESLASDTDTLPPLAERSNAPLKHHTRSSSCDSYFEPWQVELADMRLRLSPQERDHHMFSEEDDTAVQNVNHQEDSVCSSAPGSGACSCAHTPRRHDVNTHDTNERKRTNLEDQLSCIGYIDSESPRAKPPEKRALPAVPDIAKRLCKDRDSPMSSTSDFQSSPVNVKLRLCKDRDSPMSSTSDFQSSPVNVKLRERTSPRKSKSSRYTGMQINFSNENINSRLSWHGRDGHSTLIKIDWPLEHSSVSNLTSSTVNTPITPNYETLESDSEASDNKHTIKIKNCDNCKEETCLKCELKATDYENVKFNSTEHSPVHEISYKNLNRLSASSSDNDRKTDVSKVMTSSHESSSSYSNPSKQDDSYECYNFRPNYINLHSSSTSKSSPGSPLKSPLKSTISITFRSPTKVKDYEKLDETPTNDRDSIYEDIVLEKNLSIVEDASVPETDASLPTPACQPDYNQDLIILETPTQTDNGDVYSQVKFFKKTIDEVNAMIFDSHDKERHDYENIEFGRSYENVDVNTKNNEKGVTIDNSEAKHNQENGNVVKGNNLNVRELAIRFESPTEQKGPFLFEKFKAEIKYPSLERKEDKRMAEKIKREDRPPVSPKTHHLSKNSCNARSLDENAFTKEFGERNSDRRKSLEVKDVKSKKYLPDLNLNLAEDREQKIESITPTTENKISLIQRFDVKKPDLKNIITLEGDKTLSRERIEKYKEERRNFLREKYSSQSFRSNPEQLTRIKIKKDGEDKIETCERLKDSPKFERRNTMDLGQKMKFTLAKSVNNIDDMPSPTNPKELEFRRDGERAESSKRERSRDSESRKEKMSPSYNIRDMAAMFEMKSQNNSG